MKSKDEIVDEVRAVREAYAARFNYDLAKIYEDLKTKEQARGNIAELQQGIGDGLHHQHPWPQLACFGLQRAQIANIASDGVNAELAEHV